MCSLVARIGGWVAPAPSHPNSGNTDGDRATHLQHAVQDRDGDTNLGGTTWAPRKRVAAVTVIDRRLPRGRQVGSEEWLQQSNKGSVASKQIGYRLIRLNGHKHMRAQWVNFVPESAEAWACNPGAGEGKKTC